jgi:hypothetical protein
MKSFSLLHPRDQIVCIMECIDGHEMTTTSGGNISEVIQELLGAFPGL